MEIKNPPKSEGYVYGFCVTFGFANISDWGIWKTNLGSPAGMSNFAAAITWLEPI